MSSSSNLPENWQTATKLLLALSENRPTNEKVLNAYKQILSDSELAEFNSLPIMQRFSKAKQELTYSFFDFQLPAFMGFRYGILHYNIGGIDVYFDPCEDKITENEFDVMSRVYDSGDIALRTQELARLANYHSIAYLSKSSDLLTEERVIIPNDKIGVINCYAAIMVYSKFFRLS